MSWDVKFYSLSHSLTMSVLELDDDDDDDDVKQLLSHLSRRHDSMSYQYLSGALIVPCCSDKMCRLC